MAKSTRWSRWTRWAKSRKSQVDQVVEESTSETWRTRDKASVKLKGHSDTVWSLALLVRVSIRLVLCLGSCNIRPKLAMIGDCDNFGFWFSGSGNYRLVLAVGSLSDPWVRPNIQLWNQSMCLYVDIHTFTMQRVVNYFITRIEYSQQYQLNQWAAGGDIQINTFRLKIFS